MWLFKWMMCIIRGHVFTDISLGESPYRYCLRCGMVKVPEANAEGKLIKAS